MSQRFLYLFVFITGATIMSTEMTASRLIAPYFGTSIIVWANIIGIILLAMSAGYFFGGRLADRHPEPKLLFSLSIAAGLILTLIPLISQGIFHFLTAGILATPISITLIAFVCTLLVLAPPIFLLAMVSPFALRLSSPSAQDTGKISGRLNAFSTLGSLLGTFLPALVLIPSIGTKSTIYCAAFMLIMISALGLKRSWAYFLAVIPLLLLFLTPHIVKANQEILWEKETSYQYVQVVRQNDDSVALVYNEGGGVQSISRPNHGLIPQDYYDYYLLLPFLRNEEKKPKVWILGSAGGTMLSLFNYWVRQALPALSLTGVEIDPEVIPLGKKFFGLDGTEGQVVNSDARTFLNSRSDKTDLVIVDAYTQQIYIPFHLSTQEFYQIVQEHLNPGGILAMNINAISPSSSLLQAFQRTLASVFKYTYVLPVPDSLNYVVLASNEPISNLIGTNNLPSALEPFRQYFNNNIHPAAVNDGIILTDDRAPVEFLTDQMIWDTLRGTESQNFLQLTSLTKNDKNTQNSSTISSPSIPDIGITTLIEQQLSPQSSPTSPIKDSALDSSSNSQNSSPTTNADALKLYEQGLKLYYKREFSQALTFFNKALVKDTRCYQALNAKGATYAFQGKYDEGLALIKQALEINPNFVYGHFNLGLANELAGRWDPAISAYQEALRLDKQDVWSYYGIASIYGRMGNPTKVIEYLEQAIALDPGVKEVAREEKDFVPVRLDPRFQKLISSENP
ncbi:MAG: fused MFS/spermidine synthase [Desulfitobacteriaceae bacterium]